MSGMCLQAVYRVWKRVQEVDQELAGGTCRGWLDVELRSRSALHMMRRTIMIDIPNRRCFISIEPACHRSWNNGRFTSSSNTVEKGQRETAAPNAVCQSRLFAQCQSNASNSSVYDCTSCPRGRNKDELILTENPPQMELRTVLFRPLLLRQSTEQKAESVQLRKGERNLSLVHHKSRERGWR